MAKIEKDINTYIKKKDNYDQVCRPVTGYFTFEEDDCVQAIKKASPKDFGFNFEGKLVKFK